MLPVTVVHQVPGGAPFELTPIAQSVSYDSAAVGGFGGMECQVEGDVRKRFGYLGLTRVMYGSSVLWEGQLEDMPLAIGAGSVRTTLRAFGWRRLLDETSVRRIWSKRDLPFNEITVGAGVDIAGGYLKTRDLLVQTGNYDPSDLTKSGVRLTGAGQVVAYPYANGADFRLPIGLTLVRVMCDVAVAGNVGIAIAKLFLEIGDSTDGTTINSRGLVGTTGSQSVATTNGAVMIRLVALAGSNAGSNTYLGSDRIDVSNIRLLGTALIEDAADGFYGGTILRDLVALVPGLTTGIIEDGSDYTIQAIERSVRQAALSVVDEVASYYTREWAVWEDARFDWKARNLDEPQVVIPVAQFTALEIDGTLDGLARTLYVLYSDAASGLDAEASSVSTDQRNPYVRQARTKDITVQPGFPMTANTSAQLAARVAGDVAARPSVSGRCSLPATALVNNLVGSAKPAALIRGGENILIPDLPKTDPFRTGRDGETLFHIAASHVDLSTNTVTLELEGQQSRADVLLARLAASTRVLTG